MVKEKDQAAKLEALVLESNNDMKKMSKTYIELIIESGSFNGFFKYIKKDSHAKVL
jgi:hypothetical protein